MAIRELDFGLEAVYGTAATTFINLPVESFKPARKQNRARPRVTTGTRWAVHHTRRLNRQFSWELTMPLYYAMTCYPMAIHMGAPVTAAVSGATGAFTNTFKPGGSSVMSATLRWKKTNSQGTQWYQATGNKATTAKLSASSEGIPMITFSGFGKYPSAISAPGSPPSVSIENYNHPDVPQQKVTKNGTDWEVLQSLDLTSEQGLAEGFTIRQSADLQRITLGDASGEMAITSYQDAYTGSVMEQNDGDGLLDQVIVQWDDTTAIGTGTPTTPRIQITAPKPYTDDVQEGDSDNDDTEDSTLVLGYDNTTASGWKWEFRNELASSAFTGS